MNRILDAAAAALLVGCAARDLDPVPYRVGEFRPSAQDRIVPAGSTLELVWNDGDFTEGPAPGPDGAIYFTDIGNRIMRFDPKGGKTTVHREPSGKANGLMFDRTGRLVACEGASGGNRRLSVTEASGEVRTLADRWQGRRFNSPNDLAMAPDGRIYFTDPRYVGDDPREIDFEGVFLVAPGGAVTLATRDVQRPNGILVSADGRWVYVADNHSDPKGNHHLLRFRAGADGALVDRRVMFDIGPDRRGIDGMTLDLEGNIYATAGTGDLAGIYVFSPRGEPLAFIRTPGDPTNCVFGGPAEPTTLYVTAHGPPAAKRRWALYRIKLAHRGYHVVPFRG
jgi:gluconolactonase